MVNLFTTTSTLALNLFTIGTLRTYDSWQTAVRHEWYFSEDFNGDYNDEEGEEYEY